MAYTLLSDEKNDIIYSAQITPFRGKVIAEIICKKDCFKDKQLDLWRTSVYKEFGKSFQDAPREKDWINARKFINEQMILIKKYGTVIVSDPIYLNDL